MKITIIGNKDGIYINPVNCNAAGYDYTKAENFSEIDMEGVNHLVVTRTMHPYKGEQVRIVQSSGYTTDKGIFVNIH